MRGKITTQKAIILTFLVVIGVYGTLNLVWNLTSTEFLPSNAIFDMTRRPEQIELLWTKYRKGHTTKTQ